MKKKPLILKFVSLIVLISLLLTFLIVDYFILQKYTYQEFSYNAILNSRKELLKGNVDRTIGNIEFLEKNVISEYTIFVNFFGKDIRNSMKAATAEMIPNQESVKNLIELIVDNRIVEDKAIYEDIDVVLYNKRDEIIIYATEDIKNMNDFLKNDSLRTINFVDDIDHISIYVYLNTETLNKIVKERAKEKIRELRVEGSKYLWINEVINYEGGQDYAIRLVHPNLPETEGILLSTETRDIEGNKPYQVELDGINAAGEVYFTYYFKEFEGSQISEKMTYAKLYKPYNWIIATGIYMTDMKELQLTKNMNEKNAKYLNIAMLLTVIILCLVIYLVLRFLYKSNKRLENQIVEHKNNKEKINMELGIAKDMAYKDSLTDILNRRGLFDRLDQELSRFKRQKYELCLVLVDIDYFKHINDTYGHNFGDEALKFVASALAYNVRKEDIIGRLGGDEFLYILPYTSVDEATEIIETISEYIKTKALSFKGIPIVINLSVGITAAQGNDTIDTIIKRADYAMYQSKRGGRNRITKV